MSKKLVDEEGNEVEALTPEELDAQQAEAVTVAENKLREEYEGKVKETQMQLEAEKKKEKDFAKLRELKEKSETDLKELKEKYDKEVTEEREKELVEYKDQLFTALAGKDDELKKKIEFHFARFGSAATTDKTEIDKLGNDALRLAMGETGGAVSGDVVRTGGGAPLKPGEIPSHLIPHAKAMGMSEEEFIKNYQKAKQQGLIKD